jgi:hypothetical protein
MPRLIYKTGLILTVLTLLGSTAVAVAVPEIKDLLLPQFLDLPFNSASMPPECEEALRQGKLDLRKVAVSLVQRKRLFQERWERPSEDLDLPENFPRSCDEVEIISFFPEQHLDSLLKDGQLNMHQTGQSRGLVQMQIRTAAENSMIGIKLEAEHNADPKSPLHFLRPKYGIVNFKKPCGVRVNPNRLLIYGQLIIVYNDDVKARTMYTYGDSLYFYCHHISGELGEYIEPHSLLAFSPPPKKEFWDVRYVEAQIWGPVDLSDIREFRIPRQRQDLLEKLKKADKPVYSYSRETMEECDYHMDEALIGLGRGKLLYNPKP